VNKTHDLPDGVPVPIEVTAHDPALDIALPEPRMMLCLSS